MAAIPRPTERRAGALRPGCSLSKLRWRDRRFDKDAVHRVPIVHTATSGTGHPAGLCHGEHCHVREYFLPVYRTLGRPRSSMPPFPLGNLDAVSGTSNASGLSQRPAGYQPPSMPGIRLKPPCAATPGRFLFHVIAMSSGTGGAPARFH